LLGELEGDGRIVVFDMEAGVGTLLRMEPGQADVVLVVAQPTAKSIEVARRAVEIATDRAEVVVLANRVRDEVDLETIRAGLPEHELVVVPDDPVIEHADREGLAPIDVDPSAPGVRALRELADRLAGHAVKA
jgi:CO dehydrogenase nickel-insertion accessory protein CooC1